jgi:predicted ATPase
MFCFDKNCLIILDNFEHVIDAARVVTDLLSYASGMTILITSREPLRISGEHLFCVPPLDFLDLQGKTPIEKLVDQPAVTLFCYVPKLLIPVSKLPRKTQRKLLNYALLGRYTSGHRTCGSQYRTNFNTNMINRSQNRLKWLNNGARDLEDRQRTLRNTIEWGYTF